MKKIGIIGGGASGVMVSIAIKKQHKDYDITIIEQNDRLLKKVLKTGNGKCNIMNNNIKKEFYNDFHLIEKYKDIIDVKEEFLSLGLVLKELTQGRVYPYSEQASNVVNVLIDNVNKLGTNVILQEKVIDIKYNNKFTINNKYQFDKLIIATGSYSQEKTNGYDLLKKMGLNVTNLYPGLVPVVTKEKTKHLTGLRVKAKDNKYNLEGEVLFKDDGLSGILIFDLSRHLKANDIISLDLMSEYSIDEVKNLIKSIDSIYGIFPKMLAKDIIDRSNNDLKLIPNIIKNYTFTIESVKGYNESQITIGGLDLNEIDDNFMVKKINDLYVIGEVLNVDGACGGYNLYFAWLSALACSRYV